MATIDETGTRVARIDALARSLAERASSLTFTVAGSDDEREATWRLRWQAVVDNGWADPDSMPNGLECDKYDDGREIVVVGKAGDRIIASGRIVLPYPDRALPVESAFGVEVHPRGKVVQVDRLVVDRDFTAHDHHVLGGVLAECWLQMRERGFQIAAGADSPAMIRIFRMLGMRITPIGPPRRYWGEDRQPCTFDPGGTDAPDP